MISVNKFKKNSRGRYPQYRGYTSSKKGKEICDKRRKK